MEATAAVSYPVARTPEEALHFLEIQPCPRCGVLGFQAMGAIYSDGVNLLRRYSGPCARCGTAREYLFRQPAQPEPPAPPGYARFGGAQPSQLLDAGQWLEMADDYARELPADPAQVPPAELSRVRQRLAYALAALDEAAKFIPPGADTVPEPALWTPRSRDLWHREQFRFRRAVIDAYRQTFHDTIRAYTPAPTAPPHAAAQTSTTNAAPAAAQPPAPAPAPAPADGGRTGGAVPIVDPRTGLRYLDGTGVRLAARTLIAAEPLLHGTPAAEVAARLGWQPAAEQRSRSVLKVDAGLGVGGYTADLRLSTTAGTGAESAGAESAGVESITVPLSDVATPISADGVAFCREAFAHAGRELTARLGPPTETRAGSEPSMQWRLEQVTLQLWGNLVAVSLNVLTNELYDERAWIAGQEQP